MTAISITRKHKKLRDSAKGRNCSLRIFPHCNHSPETTVLCHLPSGSGFGQKSPDWFAAFGCSSCHDIIDGRVPTDLDKCEVSKCMNRGLFETQSIWISEGYLKL